MTKDDLLNYTKEESISDPFIIFDGDRILFSKFDPNSKVMEIYFCKNKSSEELINLLYDLDGKYFKSHVNVLMTFCKLFNISCSDVFISENSFSINHDFLKYHFNHIIKYNVNQEYLNVTEFPSLVSFDSV